MCSNFRNKATTVDAASATRRKEGDKTAANVSAGSLQRQHVPSPLTFFFIFLSAASVRSLSRVIHFADSHADRRLSRASHVKCNSLSNVRYPRRDRQVGRRSGSFPAPPPPVHLRRAIEFRLSVDALVSQPAANSINLRSIRSAALRSGTRQLLPAAMYAEG